MRVGVHKKVAGSQAIVRAAVRFRLIADQGGGTQIADDYDDAVRALRARYGDRLDWIAAEGEC